MVWCVTKQSDNLGILKLLFSFYLLYLRCALKVHNEFGEKYGNAFYYSVKNYHLFFKC
jgi:hypothetical protein